MPGLSLGAGAQVRASSQASYGNAAPNASTAYAAGFGVGSDSGSTAATGLAALLPNDPAGIGFWFGVGCFAALIFMYHSLPA
jgi:hypothetical protein